MHNLLIFGGTFDPIHLGHLQIALNIQQTFAFEQFIFLPCKIPVLKKDAVATPEQRVNMIRLAIDQCPEHAFNIDTREIERQTPSYMFTTLASYRQDYGQDCGLYILMGDDAFRQLPAWHQWQAILNMANILVVNRPGEDNHSLPIELINYLSEHETHHMDEFKSAPHGKIFQYNAGRYEMSSSQVRKALKNNQGEEFLPKVVVDYIQNKGLYRQA